MVPTEDGDKLMKELQVLTLMESKDDASTGMPTEYVRYPLATRNCLPNEWSAPTTAPTTPVGIR
jgi:hypothetical protein